ncbi:MAG: cation:proton antiporter [Methanomassiliicoccales archaeon]|nr:cation:proton antiporter [Methanomassiliicoccales archaeon]MDD1755357.1 cation:proton antiporter [Methanomassiliicoccales archaeon]
MDTTTQFMLEIALITIIAGVCSVVFTKLRFPVVIGYIVAGMLLGPTVIGEYVYFDTQVIDFLANIGIALLMFSIGLDFNLKRLKKIGGFAILAGTVEVALMLLVGYSLGLVLGFGTSESIFLAAIMAISSTAVIFKVLVDTGNMSKEWVDAVIGILIIEDLAGVILLTVTSPLLTGQNPDITSTIGIFLAIVAFIAFSLVLGLAVVPWLINGVAKRYSSETLLLVSLGLCFGFALFAVGLGLSLTIGAFIMGVLISQSKHGEDVTRKIGSIKEMFLAVFFVSIGMLVDPVLVVQGLLIALVIALVFVIGKTFSVTIGCYMANLPARTSFYAGAAMVAIGEVSFILANSGVQAGVLSNELYASIIGASIITMVVLPISIRSGPRELDWIVRHLPKRLLSSLTVIEGVRMDLRRRLSASAERRAEIRRQLFWLFIDVVIFILIQFFGLMLLAASNTLDGVADVLGVSVAAVALVLTVALALPVILDILSHLNKLVAALTYTVTGTKAYKLAKDTFVFRLFKRLIRIAVVIILLLTLAPIAYALDSTHAAAAIIFIALGLLLAYFIWGYLHSSYERMSSALTKNLVENEEQK